MSHALPSAIGRPATNALAAVGIVQLDDLDKLSEQELAELPGVGPKAIAVLKQSPDNILAIMRAASTKPEAAPQLRDVFVRRMMLPMIIELGLSRPHERAVLLASLVTGLTFVHTMLDFRSERPDLDRSAELELISAAVELVLTIEIL
ncbi:hypothetical protein IWX81_002474 [Salinibacterium sp. CAN_S4]|uniref:TetR/AcrR family transcriptional regulator n=1 Tax=Salinibacterium sp. CAN_S4 TaxID=2787727 RepID=UPI0018F029BE